jgi:anti-sigma B factor antagonist
VTVEWNRVAGSQLALSVTVGDAITTIRLSGELDISAADGLLERLDAELARGSAEIVMDLSELTFIDSTGLRTLLQARDKCEWRDVGLSIVHDGGHVARVFELTGLRSVLPVVRDASRVTEATG